MGLWGRTPTLQTAWPPRMCPGLGHLQKGGCLPLAGEETPLPISRGLKFLLTPSPGKGILLEARQ